MAWTISVQTLANGGGMVDGTLATCVIHPGPLDVDEIDAADCTLDYLRAMEAGFQLLC
jgi:hypothetical protein